MKLESLLVTQKPGTGTAIHRYQVYRSINGAAFEAVGETLDIAITEFSGELAFATPIACAKLDRIAVTVLLLSGSISSGSVNLSATLVWELT
jgi:hypothetical protein